MATVSCVDFRRMDQRNAVQPEPLWVTSGLFDLTATGKGALLMSFPTTLGKLYAIHGLVLEVAILFAGGTPSIDVGLGTIALDTVTTGGDITIVDADGLIPSADITEGTKGKYPALTGAAVTLWAAGQMQLITCADTAVPVIYATLSSGLTAGAARLHVLMSRIPVQS